MKPFVKTVAAVAVGAVGMAALVAGGAVFASDGLPGSSIGAVLTSSDRPGILLGKIQSGKTRAFLGVIAEAFDNGYDIAVSRVGGGQQHAHSWNRVAQLPSQARKVEAAQHTGANVRRCARELGQVADLGQAVGKQSKDRQCAELRAGEIEHDELGCIVEVDDDAVTRP